MNKNTFKKTSALLLAICLLLSLVGCAAPQEPVASPQEEATTVQEPQKEEATELAVVTDDEIKEIENLIKANEHLELEIVDKDKYYSLEEITVYFMNMFRLSEEAINKNYQCPFPSVKEENKPLIAYAYATRLLTGVSDEDMTNVESEKIINNTASLVLSLMGYSNHDSNKDYDLEKAAEFLNSLGLELDSNTGKLRGDYLIKLTNNMLDKNCKDATTVKTKLEKLGVFKEAAYQESLYIARGDEVPKSTTIASKPKTSSSSSNTEQNTTIYSDPGTSSGGSGSGSGGGETHVDPTPVNPTPVNPTPVNPTPVDPTPVDPTPVDPTPVDPSTGGGGGDNELPSVDF